MCGGSYLQWPGYEQEGGYIPLRGKDGHRISRQLFAQRVANLVAQRLVKFSVRTCFDVVVQGLD